MRRFELGQGKVDTVGDRFAQPFGRLIRPAPMTARTIGARQLSHEELAFCFALLGTHGVVAALRVRAVVP